MAKTVKSNKNTRSKKSVFYFISALIPIFFFLLFELVLRIIGFGQTSPLFIENPAHEDYLLARPDVMTRYFPFSKNPPNVTMETDFFLKEKPENGIRVFVQGGSTAAGFPYGLGASLSGTLEQRLRQSLPAHHVEVVNTAMSAVNSHTLLDLADEIIEQEPDMVLIYAGHNEFLGILGASSNFTTSSSFWLTRLMINLKDVRIFQLFQFLFAELSSNSDNLADNSLENTNATAPEIRKTMMAKVAANQSIELNSPVYKAGLKQFSANLSDLLSKYQDAGIPVFVASIASNHKDQAPLKSKDIEPQYQSLVNNLGANRSSMSVQELKNVADALLGSESALLHFELGKLLEQRKLVGLAAKHYKLAVSHDLLKFRAPEAINDIIKELSAKYQANYVDAKLFFSQRSQNNIVGQELMLEHLHPNLRGYYVMSEAFYASIASAKLFSPWKNQAINKAWSQRLVLPSEEYYGYAVVENLKTNYPFVEQPTSLSLTQPVDVPQALGRAHFNGEIDWLSMMQKNLEYYQSNNDELMSMKTLQILADALPHNGLYSVQAAEMLERQSEYALAVFYYQRAIKAGAIDSGLANKINVLQKRAL